MTTRSHDACRRAVASEDIGPDVEDHLAGCTACASFAVAVGQLSEAATSIRVPDPPPGLADRVLERVAAERSRPVAADRRGRRWLQAGVAIAAAVAVLLGAVALVDDDDPSPQEILLAAASRTEEAGTATITVEGGAAVAVPAGTSFESAPDEMQAYMQHEWARAMAEFEQGLAEFESRTDDALDDAFRRMEEAFGAGPARPPSPPSPPRSPSGERRPEPAPAPDTASLGFSFSGAGAVDFDGGIVLRGSLRPVAGTVRAPDATADFAVAGRAGDAAAAGPLGSVLLAPDGLTRLLRSSTGDVAATGGATVGGVGTTRYRFRATGVDPSGVTGAWDVDAYIDGDRLLRRIDVRAAGRVDGTATQWSDRASVVLSDFGFAEVVAAMDAAAPMPGARTSLPIHPFGPAVAATLRARP